MPLDFEANMGKMYEGGGLGNRVVAEGFALPE